MYKFSTVNVQCKIINDISIPIWRHALMHLSRSNRRIVSGQCCHQITYEIALEALLAKQ